MSRGWFSDPQHGDKSKERGDEGANSLHDERSITVREEPNLHLDFCLLTARCHRWKAFTRSLSHLLGVAGPCVLMTLARAIEAWSCDRV